ncbi:MAG: dienelactone hydrolase family protein, partial [Pseudomonadota bacterium]|nr:dienelactone hydrolase family protein [Pseudomonadota bacterium]
MTLSGGREVAAYLARPAKKFAPAVMLLYEWWGLNDQIKNVARELAQEGFLELAVDLMDGRVATTRNDTKRLMVRV